MLLILYALFLLLNAEHHLQNVQKFKKELIHLKSNSDNCAEHDSEAQQLWQRLEELEKEESYCKLR